MAPLIREGLLRDMMREACICFLYPVIWTRWDRRNKIVMRHWMNDDIEAAAGWGAKEEVLWYKMSRCR